jgi:hypothetical protein
MSDPASSASDAAESTPTAANGADYSRA